MSYNKNRLQFILGKNLMSRQHHCFNEKQDTHHIKFVFNLKARKKFVFVSRLRKQTYLGIVIFWDGGRNSWKMKNVWYFPNHYALIWTLSYCQRIVVRCFLYYLLGHRYVLGKIMILKLNRLLRLHKWFDHWV